MTKPKSMAVLVLAGLALSACVSEEEMAARRQMAQANREKQCASFGYKLGTPDYSKCLESLYLQDQQLAAAEEANRQARQRACGSLHHHAQWHRRHEHDLPIRKKQ